MSIRIHEYEQVGEQRVCRRCGKPEDKGRNFPQYCDGSQYAKMRADCGRMRSDQRDRDLTPMANCFASRIEQLEDEIDLLRHVSGEAEQRGRAAERADVVAHLRQSAADYRDLELFDSEQAVSDEADDIEAGRHVGAAGKGEA